MLELQASLSHRRVRREKYVLVWSDFPSQEIRPQKIISADSAPLR